LKAVTILCKSPQKSMVHASTCFISTAGPWYGTVSLRYFRVLPTLLRYVFMGMASRSLSFPSRYIDPRENQESYLSMHGPHKGGLGYIARGLNPLILLIPDLEISTR
jgi:hypothetical protein